MAEAAPTSEPANNGAEISAEVQASGGWLRDVHDFIEGHTRMGAIFENFIALVIVVNVIAYFLFTEPALAVPMLTLYPVIETWCISIFCVEYAVRFVSIVASDEPSYKDPVWGRLSFMGSFWSVVDLACIIPFFIPGMPSVSFLRTLRLLRLIRAEKYSSPEMAPISVFTRVWGAKSAIIVTTGFVAMVVWVLVSTLMYETQQGRDELDGHYDSIVNAMWYTLLMLTTEYPDVDFNGTGRVISMVMGLMAVGLVGVPTGIVIEGFMDEVDRTKEQRVEKLKALQAKRDLQHPRKCDDCFVAEATTFRAQVYVFMRARTTWGQRFDLFILIVIMVNVLNFIVGTVPEVEAVPSVMTLLDVIEWISMIIFTFEYVTRLWSIVEDPFYSHWLTGRLRYATTFFLMVDLIAIVPFYVGLVFTVGGNTAIVRAVRLIRMLKADKYTSAFQSFKDVILLNAGLLGSTAYICCVIWVILACLMHNLEKFNDDDEYQERFGSAGSAMFYTLLMMSGEFPLADFTVLGKLLGCVICVGAVMLFAIPTGVLGGGFEEVIKQNQQTEIKCEKCGVMLKEAIVPPGVDTLVEAAHSDVSVHRIRRERKRAALKARFEAEAKAAQDEAKKAEADRLNAVPESESLLHQGQYKDPNEDATTFRDKLFRFLSCKKGGYPGGQYFDTFIVCLIVVNILLFILGTDPDLVAEGSKASRAFDTIELISVIIFTLEWSLRLYAAADDPYYVASKYPRVLHFFSFFAMIDFFAVFPYYLQIFSDTPIIPTTVLRVFRLLRLLKGEKYGPVQKILSLIHI